MNNKTTDFKAQNQAGLCSVCKLPSDNLKIDSGRWKCENCCFQQRGAMKLKEVFSKCHNVANNQMSICPRKKKLKKLKISIDELLNMEITIK